MSDNPVARPTASPANSDSAKVGWRLYHISAAGMFGLAVLDLMHLDWLGAVKSACMAGFYALLFRALKPDAKRWQYVLYWACIIGYTAAWSWQRAHRAPL